MIQLELQILFVIVLNLAHLHTGAANGLAIVVCLVYSVQHYLISM